jgi:hypothetical protein
MMWKRNKDEKKTRIGTIALTAMRKRTRMWMRRRRKKRVMNRPRKMMRMDED